MEQSRQVASLERAEELSDSIFRQVTVGVALTDLTGRVLRANERCCELLGRRVAETPGLLLQECMHAEDRAGNPASFDSLASGGRDFTIENRYVRPDGSTVWVNTSLILLRDPAGDPTSALVLLQEITGRKEAEDRLSAQQRELDLALEAGRVGTWEWDVGTKKIQWSQGLLEVHGRAGSESPDSFEAVLDEVHPDDRERFLQTVYRALEERQADYHTEYRVIGLDGDVRWVEGRGKVYCDASGRPVRMAGICMNVTDRKIAEEALEESDERVTSIVENISEAFVALDRQWRFTYLNKKAVELLGRAREDVLGRNAWEVFPKASGTRLFAELHRAMLDGVAAHFEERHGALDARYELDAYPTRNGLAIFCRDVTESKRLQEHLRQTQKLESIGVLAGGVAHDFNNLLAGIMGNASLALSRIPKTDPAISYLEPILQASERAAQLTRQMLAYAGRGKFVFGPVSISALVREIVGLIHTSIPKSVQVSLELDPDLPFVEADSGQLQQLIMNLVINGAEAVAEGRNGNVTVRTSLEVVSQTSLRSAFVLGDLRKGRYVSLEVRDDGCGLDENVITRIFDPFFTTKFTGRGLGLAAALGIIRSHRGAIVVSSVLGQGSSFKVLVPPMPAGTAISADEVKQVTVTGTGTILVVDDEKLAREAATRVLEGLGYHTLSAAHGEDAVRIFRKAHAEIALVLLDLAMPFMGGEETFRELVKIRPDVPVILTSGYNEDDAVRRFGEHSPAGFIQKPYAAASLAQTVERALRR
jgi:PAS domain S-box-containing protein